MSISKIFNKAFPDIVPIAVLSFLTFFRGYIFVFFEQAHFDSDQAIVGLMAKHLSELRAFPLYFYGQDYLLGIEAWMAAPLFSLFGPSVTSLKLPILGLNIIVVNLLYLITTRQVGLTRLQGFIVALSLAILPIGPSSQFVAPYASNIEPFLWTLLIWLASSSPWLQGGIAAFGFANREFTIYAVVAFFLIFFIHNRGRKALLIRFTGKFIGSSFLTYGLIRILAPLSSNWIKGARVKYPIASLNIAVENFQYYVAQLLPILYGGKEISLKAITINSELSSGSSWVGYILVSPSGMVETPRLEAKQRIV